jgi:hypothetical protein
VFADLLEQLDEALNENVRKDITGYRRTLVRKGKEALLANPGMISKRKMEKWGLTPSYHDRQTAKMNRRYELMMAKSRRDKAAKAAADK